MNEPTADQEHYLMPMCTELYDTAWRLWDITERHHFDHRDYPPEIGRSIAVAREELLYAYTKLLRNIVDGGRHK